ncbi:sulfurtransferase [Vulcanisaeta sp. JCM 16159]|uniref:sulfurtransferase n=1 Tax=Vulcanisaeta sp. JCM 16159 TaxID=1295371 RepID=UPI0006D0FD2A|nr:rhodanese-like domain-containing protein [Vulcanisaeta sp. JCM 16159]
MNKNIIFYTIDNRHAAIVYMVLKALGFKRVSLLNGGKVNWLVHKGPLCTCNWHVYRGNFNPGDWLSIIVNFNDYFINFDQVYELFANGNIGNNTLLIDVRSPCEYMGSDVDIWGHIPGAINMPWNLFLESRTNRFRDHDEIMKVVDSYGLSPNDDIILYCRTGGRSALVWFALTELLGFSRVRVYLGSWLDWMSHGAPIKRSEEP